MRALLISVDAATRQWLEESLAPRRHEAVTADDLESALAALRAGPFPVIVLRFGQSADEGGNVCRRLRAAAPPDECLLLAVGREEHPPELPAWFAAGLDDYLVAHRDTRRLEARLAGAEHRQPAHVAPPAVREQKDRLAAHEELQAVYDRMSDGVLIADVETRRFLRVNPAACRMLGYSEAELLGMGIESIHPPEDVPKYLAAFAEGSQGRLSEVSDFRCLHKNGATIDVDIVSACLTYRGRACLVGFFRDITERKRAVEALRIQRDLGAILSSTSDLDAALNAILQAACSIPGVDGGGVYLVDEHGGLYLAAHSGVSPEFVDAVQRYPHGSPEAQLAAEGGALYVARACLPPTTNGALAAEGLRSVAIVPVKHEGRLVALLNAASRTRDELPLSTRHTLETLASRLGGVIVRLRTRQELIASRDNLQSLFDAIDDFLFILDGEGRIQHVNPVVERRLGYAAAELCGRPVAEVHPPEQRDEAAAIVAAILAGRENVCSIPLLAKNGAHIPVEIKVTRGRWNHKPALFGVARDITVHLQMERALREHDATISTLFANLPDFVLLLDCNGTLQFANRGAPGATVEDLRGSDGFSFLAPESQDAAHESFARAIATRQVQSVEVLDIYGVWWACRLVPMIEDDEVRGIMIICTDVSEQRKAAEAVKKEQQLLRQLIDLHERDRQVIAYEIHDGFAQQLTAALYGFQAYERLRKEVPEKAAGPFESGMKLLSSSIDEARRLIGGLRPPILDEFGIVAAIEYLVHDCHARGGPEVSFDYDVTFDRLAPPLESALFRIVQEALTNVGRHSRSAKATVGLSQAGDRIHVNVRDWGVGFDPARVEEGRFGLQGIRERVRLLGGRAVITTAPGQGTQIFVELPLIEAAATDGR